MFFVEKLGSIIHRYVVFSEVIVVHAVAVKRENQVIDFESLEPADSQIFFFTGFEVFIVQTHLKQKVFSEHDPTGDRLFFS